MILLKIILIQENILIDVHENIVEQFEALTKLQALMQDEDAVHALVQPFDDRKTNPKCQ